MGNWAHLNNRDNSVIEVIEWDGVSETPIADRPKDTSLIPLEGTAVPAVGAIWNGTAFDPPAEEPPVDPPGRRSKKDKDDD